MLVTIVMRWIMEIRLTPFLMVTLAGLHDDTPKCRGRDG